MKNLQKGFVIPLVIAIIVVLAVGTGIYYSTNKKTETPVAVTNVSTKTGSLIVSNTQNQPAKTVNYGTKDVELFSFNLKMDSTEDSELTGIAVQFYSTGNIEKIEPSALTNLRLIDESGNVFGRTDELSFLEETAPDRTYRYTTNYAWFNGKSRLLKNSTKTYRLLADISVNSSLPEVRAVLPSFTSLSPTFGKGISALFKISGLSSHQPLNITGEASEMVYFKPQNNIGSVTVWSDPTFLPKYPRLSKQVVLSKIYILAGQEEDVSLSKVAVRISNFVPGQFKNVKLVREEGVQYGTTIESPKESERDNLGDIDTNIANLIFNGNDTLKAGQTATFDLIADVAIPSTGEYGTDLQREVIIYVLNPNNSSQWITAKGVNSGKGAYVFGAVDTRLQFTD